jgi:thiol-disulfide isomerase/thioredoxin
VKHSFKKKLGVIVLCMFGGALGLAASRYGAPKQGNAPMLAPVITLKNIEGHDITLDAWKGKLLLVNFWASWCAPCRNEMPLLVSAQKQYGAHGLQIIGPALDDAESVKAIVAELKLNYPVMADYNSADAAMLLLGNAEGGLPFSVLIDEKGRIIKTVLGEFNRLELDKLIAAHLPQLH